MRVEKLSYKETAAFCHDLALLVQAGIGLSDGVFLMAGEEKGSVKDTFKKVMHKRFLLLILEILLFYMLYRILKKTF